MKITIDVNEEIENTIISDWLKTVYKWNTYRFESCGSDIHKNKKHFKKNRKAAARMYEYYNGTDIRDDLD